MNARIAIDGAAHARYRQATLPALLHLVRQRGNHRIEQDRAGYRRRVGVALAVIETEDHQLQIDPDLRRSQPDASGRVHGIEHVGDQRPQAGRLELIDRFSDLQQARIAHAQDFADHRRAPNPR